jgi:hypothetical protein
MGGKFPVDAGFIYDKSFCDTSFTEVHDKRTLYLWCGLKMIFYLQEIISFRKAVCINDSTGKPFKETQ